MISDFSSLIELFAAIYLTICFDDLLLRRFWTPDYGEKIEKAFKAIDIPQFVKTSTIDSAKLSSSKEENRSRKRGALLFALTIILLVIIGFEKSIDGIGNLGQSMLYIGLLVFTLISYMFDVFFLRSWWRVLGTVGFISIAFFGCFLFLTHNKSYQQFMAVSYPTLVNITKVVLVFCLVFPVIWQLFRNWIYSRYYLEYILDQVIFKANEYNKALNCDPKKGHRVSGVAPVYLDAVGDAIASGKGDRLVKPFTDILQREMSTIEYVPSLLPLSKYSFKSYQDSHYSKKKLKKYYDMYNATQPHPKMEQFCTDNGIRYDLFHAYHIKQIKDN